jgi:hypothetical protein
VKECDTWDVLHAAFFRNDFRAISCPQNTNIKIPKLGKTVKKENTCKQILAKEFSKL